MVSFGPLVFIVTLNGQNEIARQFIAIRKVFTSGRLFKDKCHLSYHELIYHFLTHSQTKCFIQLMNRATSLQRLHFGFWIACFKASGSVAE